MAQLGVPFELAIVASEIGSYKPALGHWQAFEGGSAACRTCTSRPASSTTSLRRTSSGCPRSGSTGSARPRGRRRRASCPTWCGSPTPWTSSREHRAPRRDARRRTGDQGTARRARACGFRRARDGRRRDPQLVRHAEPLDPARRARRRAGRLPGHHLRGQRPLLRRRPDARSGGRAGAARGRRGARTRDREDADSARFRPGRRAGAPAGLRSSRLASDPPLVPDADRPRRRPARAGLAGRARPGNAEPGEDERVYEAHMDSFADHWDFRREPLEVVAGLSTDTHRFDPSLWWLVEDGDELAAISLNSWHFSGDPQFGWIHVLGVRPPWRRRGLRLRCCGTPSATSASAARPGSASAWTARTRPARFGSTRASACARSAATTPTRRRCEPAARALSRLQHASPRSRSGPATSATPAAASSAPAWCACRRPGARAASRWPRPRACRSPFRRPRSSRRTRSTSRRSRSRSTCRSARSSSAAAAARTSARSRRSPPATAGSRWSGSTRTAT